jgi:PASTA domain
LDVQRELQSRPARTNVPSIKGLNYQDAETKLRASNLNIRLLATRYDLPLQPGLIIDQSPQPGEEVVYGYAVGVTITKADFHGPGSVTTTLWQESCVAELVEPIVMRVQKLICLLAAWEIVFHG